jgi:trans-aconitate methyltransferase
VINRENVNLAADIGPSIEGVPIQGESRPTGVTNARWLVSDDDLSQLLEPIDLFHSYNVLQHLPVSRGMAILARAVTRLAPGGVIAVHVPYADRASALRHAVNWAQAHVPGIHALANLARRRPVDYPHMTIRTC